MFETRIKDFEIRNFDSPSKSDSSKLEPITSKIETIISNPERSLDRLNSEDLPVTYMYVMPRTELFWLFRHFEFRNVNNIEFEIGGGRSRIATSATSCGSLCLPFLHTRMPEFPPCGAMLNSPICSFCFVLGARHLQTDGNKAMQRSAEMGGERSFAATAQRLCQFAKGGRPSDVSFLRRLPRATGQHFHINIESLGG